MPRLGEVPLIPWGGCELGEGCVGVGGSGTAARRLLEQQLQRFKKKKSLSIRLSKCLSEAGEATINIG